MAAGKVDLSEFYRLSRPKKPPCKVGFARSQLDVEEGKKFDAALNVEDGIITNKALVEWLELHGHDVNVQQMIAHRRTITRGGGVAGKCSCGDD